MTQPQTVEIQTDEQAEARDMTATLTHRLAEMKPRGVDVEARRIEMSISSEQPVARSFGNEILEHTEDAIDLEFLASGRAPLLLDHDPSQQIGVIESVQLDGEARRLRATARLGRGELATTVLRDVEDGIRTNISVGYSIDKLERREGDDFVATRWRPLEASLVSIPADTSDIVGVGRSNQTEITTPETTHTEAIVAEDNIAIDIDAVRAEALADAQKAAQKQVAQILELGARHNQVDMAREAIQAGQQVDAFRDALLTKIETQALVAANDADIDLSAKDKKRFNLARAISAMVNPSDRRAQEAAAYEFEVSEAVAQRSGRAAQGVLMPHSVLVRDMNSSDDSAIITDDYRGDQFIDALRNASSVMAAGATTLTGLTGDVKIPRKSAGASAGWVSSEGGATSESEMTLATVSLTPKTLGAYTDVTRQLLIQSSEDVDRLIRDDLTTAIAIAIDKAALEGSGSSGQPTGILNQTGVNTVTNFAAANPTFAEVVTLQTAVSEDNALFGNLAYIVPPAMYGALKTTEKATNTAQFVVEADGSIAGYNAIVSAQATAGNLYFGNFADCLVGFFGSGVDIIVDTSTGATAGTQRIVALQSVDVAVRHAVSFAFGNDG
jgi:HK97 family phage major capsid protein